MNRLILAVSLWLLASAAYAIPVELNNAPLRNFISWYSKQTGQPVILSPDVKGNITVYSADVDKRDLKPFFISVLRANGFDLSDGNPAIVGVSKDKYEYSDSLNDDSLYDDATDNKQGDFFRPNPDLTTKTYKVFNVRAKDLAPVVDIFIQSDSKRGGGRVYPVDGANLLAVSATPEQHKLLAAFLPDVDIPRDQVLIETLMFETSEGDSFDFAFAGGRASGSKVVGGVNTSGLSRVLSSPGSSFGIFDGNILALSLQAVRRDTKAHVLSAPRIVTMSGAQGFISSGKNVPFVTGKVTGEAANVNNPFQTIDRKDVGISLSANPVVTPSGNIIMDISLRADSISNTVEASDIVTNQRQIATTVQLKDGQTLLLGGLIDDRMTDDKSDVPVISRIPIIGWLFSSKSKSSQKQAMYTLIRVRVVKAIDTRR
ncbi:general secretion pathway protein GspD [Salmonella enterica]|nr:general secretion pathway protein GspD [Salmonella enterica]